MAAATGFHPVPHEPGNLEHSHWNAGLAWTTLLSLSKGQGQTLPWEFPLTGGHRACRHCLLCRRPTGPLSDVQISLPHALRQGPGLD